MLQRVLPCGGRVASVMTRATFAFEIDGLRPRPGLSSRAARPDVSKHTDHSETRLGVVFRRSPPTSTPTPASRSRMMLALSLSRAPMVLDRDRRRSSFTTFGSAYSRLIGRAIPAILPANHIASGY